MDLAEQARIAHDQMQINRVAQAVVTVAIERRGPRARRIIADPEPVAARAVRVLAASGDAWATDNEALLAEVRAQWRLIR